MATAGGTEDGRLGTSAPRIAAALRSTLDASPEGVARPARPGQRRAQPRARARGARTRRSRTGSASARRRWSRARSSPRSRPASGRRSARSRPPPRGSHDAQAPESLTMPERRPHRHRSGRPACPSGGPFVQAASRFESRIVHPPGRARGGRQEPHRPARTDDPPVVRDRPGRRRPGRGRGPRCTRSPSSAPYLERTPTRVTHRQEEEVHVVPDASPRSSPPRPSAPRSSSSSARAPCR